MPRSNLTRSKSTQQPATPAPHGNLTHTAVMTTSRQCGYVSDGGYTCPLTLKDGDLTVLPYPDAPEQAKQDARALLCQHLGSAMKVDSEKDILAYILKHFSCATDVLYVLTRDTEAIGTVSVDRKNFFPSIGHLAIREDMQRKGHGSMLVQFAEQCILYQQFNEARLWCDASDAGLASFYTRLGYEAYDTQNNNTMYIKTLRRAKQTSMFPSAPS